METKIYDFNPEAIYDFNSKDIYIVPDSIKKLRKEKHNEEPVKVTAERIDTISSLIIESERYKDNNYKFAILNFMDYLYGLSMANPNMKLCHTQDKDVCGSNPLLIYSLFNQKDFWESNYDRFNKGLLDHRLIYTTDIEYITPNNKGIPRDRYINTDVISCSLPYKYLMEALKYEYKYKNSYYRSILKHRVQSILDVALDNNVDVLILGAIGCGSCGNNPTLVAKTFVDLLNNIYYDKFKYIVFAIPDEDKRVLFFDQIHCNLHNIDIYEYGAEDFLKSL